MAELTRITISLESSLLDAFDRHIAGKAVFRIDQT